MCDYDSAGNQPIEVNTEDLIRAIREAADGRPGLVADGMLRVAGTGTARAYGKHLPVFVVYLVDGWEDTYVLFTDNMSGHSTLYSQTAYPLYDHNWGSMWRQR